MRAGGRHITLRTIAALVPALMWALAAPAVAKGSCQSSILVAVDIGHSPAASGVKSARGKTEYSFNRRFVRELVEQSHEWPGLRLEIIPTPTVAGRGLAERSAFAAKDGADVFLSIHHDGVHDKYLKSWTHDGSEQQYSDDFAGYSIFVSRQGKRFERSVELARLVGERLASRDLKPTLHHAEKLPNENRELLDKRLGIYEAPFVVLTTNKLPAILLEVGVLVNRDEELKLEEPAHRRLFQTSILEALDAFCAGKAAASPAPAAAKR